MGQYVYIKDDKGNIIDKNKYSGFFYDDIASVCKTISSNDEAIYDGCIRFECNRTEALELDKKESLLIHEGILEKLFNNNDTSKIEIILDF